MKNRRNVCIARSQKVSWINQFMYFKILLLSVMLFHAAYAESRTLQYAHNFSVFTGLTQPLLLNGFNIAGNYTHNRWLFEYSHGMFLHYKGPAMQADYKDKLVSIMSPYSTGAGAGYRFFAGNIAGLDLRAEVKVHQYNVQLNRNEEIKYTNLDLGGGLYCQIHPFGKKTNLLKGIVIEPSIRYWKNVASTLGAAYTYHTSQGVLETHKPYPLNLFMNISLGYTFIKRK